MTPRPALSVVVACVDAQRTVARSLAALAATCRQLGDDAELLVVDASDAADARVVERAIAELPAAGRVLVRRIARPDGTLVPRLWGAGLTASRGEVVAFTTAHTIVAPEWAAALVAGVRAGAAGVAGPLALADDDGVGAVDAAVFYLRYAPYLTAFDAPRDIPGDNAAYARAALDRHAASFADGFWEHAFHHRLRAEGERLAMTPGAVARYGPGYSLATIMRHRYAHGEQFGAERRRTGNASLERLVLGAPAVPAAFAWRTLRRVWRRPADRARALRALPALLLVSAAWAAGEVVGALRGGSAPVGRARLA